MYLSTFASPTFAPLAAARAGFGPSPLPKGQLIDANYDDITVVPALPAANTLSIYDGLNYTGFATNQVGLDGTASLTGVAAHSEPNNIVSGFQQTSLTGQNAGFSVASDSKYFDLLSFYYGCSVNTVEGAEGLPQQCTFNVCSLRLLTVLVTDIVPYRSTDTKTSRMPIPSPNSSSLSLLSLHNCWHSPSLRNSRALFEEFKERRLCSLKVRRARSSILLCWMIWCTSFTGRGWH